MPHPAAAGPARSRRRKGHARAALGAVLAAFWASSVAGGAPAARGEDGPATPPSAPAEVPPGTQALLAALDAPFQSERDDAVARLAAALPEGRAAVLRAYREGTPPRRALLARVLSTDPGTEAEQALLEGLAKSQDLQERRSIMAALVARGPDALTGAKAYLAAHSVAPSARGDFAVLERLAERDQVETLFLKKKSRSGATGFYKGQFEDLRPYRDTAIEVLSHLVQNRPMPVPGVFPAGSYRFLRPPPFLVEPYELRDIAANGLSELAPKDPSDPTSVDDKTMILLAQMAQDLDRESREERGRKRRNPRGFRNFPTEADELLNVVVVTLALARPSDDDAQSAVKERIDFYMTTFGMPDGAAMLLMRMEDYESAIRHYERETRSVVLSAYNIACAYARWSEKIKDTEPAEAAHKRRLAMASLERSVKGGYADWPWMEEDRDLDAIRKEPRYAVILADMKAAFSEEAMKKALGAGRTPPPAPAPPGMGEPPPSPAPAPAGMDGR